jgi:PIF1-like helicase
LIETLELGVNKLFLKKPGCDPSLSKVLILAPTGRAAFNVNGRTIHDALKVPVGRKMSRLDPSTLSSMYSQLQDVQLIIFDEISMINLALLKRADRRLREIFGCDKPFGGKNVLFFGDLHQ